MFVLRQPLQMVMTTLPRARPYSGWTIAVIISAPTVAGVGSADRSDVAVGKGFRADMDTMTPVILMASLAYAVS